MILIGKTDMYDVSKHAALFNRDFAPDREGIIVGVGSIGSRFALHMAELDLPFALMDPDTVEQHNIANQAYEQGDIGALKVVAVREACYRKNGHVLQTYPFAHDTEKLPYGIVASCVDTMSARKRLFAAACNNTTQIFIDTRMTATSVMVYILNPSDTKQCARYRETLYDDSEVNEDTGGCSLTQSVGATAQLAASLATVRLIDWIMNRRKVFETLFGWSVGGYSEQLT